MAPEKKQTALFEKELIQMDSSYDNVDFFKKYNSTQIAKKLIVHLFVHSFNLEKAAAHMIYHDKVNATTGGKAFNLEKKEYDELRHIFLETLLFFYGWFVNKGHKAVATELKRIRPQLESFTRVKMYQGMLGEKAIDATIFKLVEKLDPVTSQPDDPLAAAIGELHRNLPSDLLKNEEEEEGLNV